MSSHTDHLEATPTADRTVLQHIARLFAELTATGSTPVKREALARAAAAHPEILPVLRHAFDTHATTGITHAGIARATARRGTIAARAPLALVALFEALETRELTGDAARAAVVTCMHAHAAHSELVSRLFTKETRTGVSIAIVSAALPDLFTVMHVALADTWSEAVHAREYARAHARAWISKKYDGVRVCIYVSADDTVPVQVMSRKGVVLASLGALGIEARAAGRALLTDAVYGAGYVLDGEVNAQNSTGADDFTLTTGLARRHAAMPDPYRFEVFDIIPIAAARAGRGGPEFAVRVAALQALACTRAPHIHVVEQTEWSETTWERERARSTREQWEGLMVRYNSEWEGRRTKRLLKWKLMQDVELRVTAVVIELIAFKLQGGGERVERALSSVVVMYRGCQVNVGSGWTVDQRREYAAHPERIVGCVITVCYQEPIHDKVHDTWSLRFPTLKAIHGATRTE